VQKVKSTMLELFESLSRRPEWAAGNEHGRAI
jgi:hypothetical protein